MAKNFGVWGIDVGQCAFKALRCTMQDGQVVADAFDFIEYPKILSQPEAEPEQMIREAMEQFLSRNELKGDKLAISVPGQSGLAKFFKPPPVDAKKIPDIVKFEARQQIPFQLEDVIWDYQQMGGMEVDGFAVDTEIGLFAMKREQVLRAIRPYQESGIELDIVQLAPLSIYNFVTYDHLAETLAGDFDPDSPPTSVVVLSMGTDTTDLVITNGFRVWQRSIPLGGNHFTKQLTKELKLTFAKAEHLKRNARQAEDPRTIFQAMRPVFNDMVTEVQRSIGYFQGIDRKAKIGGVIMLGNTVRLPGLKQYLAKNLGYEVIDYDGFKRLQGGQVLSSPAFKDNFYSYGVCYGLCLQALGAGKLQTNLIPRELLTDRMIRAKKPWAVASIGALLLACSFNFFFHYGDWYKVQENRAVNNVDWKSASSLITNVNTESSGFKQKDEQLKTELKRVSAIGEELVGNADRRLLWLEMMKAVNDALPTTPGVKPGEIPDVEKLPFDKRQELYVQYVEVEYFPDLKTWFTESVKRKYLDTRPRTEAAQAQSAGQPPAGQLGGGQPAGTPAAGATGKAAEVKGPEGEGWVVELKLHHFYNSDRRTEGVTHVQNTLLTALEEGSVALPAPANKLKPGVVVIGPNQAAMRVEEITPSTQDDGSGQAQAILQLAGSNMSTGEPLAMTVAPQQAVPTVFSYEELGLSFPVIVEDFPINPAAKVPNPNYTPAAGAGYSGGGGGFGGAPNKGMPGGMGGSDPTGSGGPYGPTGQGNRNKKDDEPKEPEFLIVPRYDCTVQIAWKETLLTDRIEAQNKAWLEELKKPKPQPAPGEQPGTGEPPAEPVAQVE